MKVFPSKTATYIQRHHQIWKELEKILKKHGVKNYSIFLDQQTHFLFGYAEIESEDQWNAIAQTESCKDWWRYMAELMETNPDNSPVSQDLEEIFHLE